MPTVEQIEIQLQRRVAEHPTTAWGRKQNDAWDRQTNFIYQLHRWDELQRAISPLAPQLADYAINRWFNFWSAMAVEQIFCTLPEVVAQTNQYDRLVDFDIQGINFDHKTSVFPQRYPYSLEFAQYHKTHLIRWLYHHQSGQQRHHLANRLFIILHAEDGQHWKLRAEIGALAQAIRAYIAEFSPAKLVELTFGDGRVVSDIIWLVR